MRFRFQLSFAVDTNNTIHGFGLAEEWKHCSAASTVFALLRGVNCFFWDSRSTIFFLPFVVVHVIHQEFFVELLPRSPTFAFTTAEAGANLAASHQNWYLMPWLRLSDRCYLVRQLKEAATLKLQQSAVETVPIECKRFFVELSLNTLVKPCYYLVRDVNVSASSLSIHLLIILWNAEALSSLLASFLSFIVTFDTCLSLMTVKCKFGSEMSIPLARSKFSCHPYL
jgi:hypothetical protein